MDKKKHHQFRKQIEFTTNNFEQIFGSIILKSHQSIMIQYQNFIHKLKMQYLFSLYKSLMTSSDQENNLTHTKKLGNLQFQAFCKSQPETAHLMYSIQKYVNKFDSFYYKSLLAINKGRSIQTIHKRLKTEFDKLTSDKSFYQIIKKGISSRQKCIYKIKRDLKDSQGALALFPKQYVRKNNINSSEYSQNVQREGYSHSQVDQTIQISIRLIRNIFTDISRLRDITIYLVENIHKWKAEIDQWTDKCTQFQPVFFIHQNKNIYDIILEDTKFIWQSPLSQYIFIQCRNDPFMVRNVIQVQKRSQKTILQKYFTQILYPKNQQIVYKAVKCYQMLTFKFKPQLSNPFSQQQLLIQNYLSLQKQINDQQEILSILRNQFQWERQVKTQRKKKLDTKGWIFGSVQNKTHTVKQIIERNKRQMVFVKPFNIKRYLQKKYLDLAYSTQPVNDFPRKKLIEIKKQKQTTRNYRSRTTHQMNRNVSPKIQLNTKIIQEKQKDYKSQSNTKSKLCRMYKSLSKLTPTIMQDSLQNQDQSPKIVSRAQQAKNKQEKNVYFREFEAKQLQKLTFSKLQQIQKDSSLQLKQSKLNNERQSSQNQQTNPIPILLTKAINKKQKKFGQSIIIDQNAKEVQKQAIQVVPQKYQLLIQQQKLKNDHSFGKIEIQQQQEQINFGQFLENFRAPTSSPVKNTQKQKQKLHQRQRKLQQSHKKLMSVRQIIEENKLKSNSYNPHRKSLVFNVKHKSPYVKDFKGILFQKINHRKAKNIQKSNNRNIQMSFVQYEQLKVLQNTQIEKEPFKFEQDFIILSSKSIPVEVVPIYLRHLFTQIHSISKKFTLYTYEELLKKLLDPYTNCIIFDISTQKKGQIGQVILSQKSGTNKKKLKYSIQFINIHNFQLVVGAILRIAEELLHISPCEQVICPLFQDKLDPLSVNFISLIQAAFKAKVPAFGVLTVLQKKKTYFDYSDLHQRLYVFSAYNKKPQQFNIPRSMVVNYQSLRFQCKCIVLSSNYLMRSRTGGKNIISDYKMVSLGYLFRTILQKIITKHHLRQIKAVQVNQNQNSDPSSLIKQSSFFRTSITALVEYLKEQNQIQDNYIHLTRFERMRQVLAYLDYKQHSQLLEFSYIQQSRFILNHQLLLAQFQMDLSLQFMVCQSINFIMLYNHHNFPLRIIEPNMNIKARSVILPTTNDQIELILTDGREYQFQTSDKLDLFSYLYMYQQNCLPYYREMYGVRQIVLPMIHRNVENAMDTVRMFDGMFRLFPQREFYSSNHFKCSNLGESYFPTAVIYNPNQKSIVFQYPLIVGFLHKKRNQILAAFILKDNQL